MELGERTVPNPCVSITQIRSWGWGGVFQNWGWSAPKVRRRKKAGSKQINKINKHKAIGHFGMNIMKSDWTHFNKNTCA